MWKTKLGRCIYESPSGFKVYQNLCYRWLTLGSNALQTVICRWRPSKPILYYLPALTLMARHTPAPTCLLGLGGAGVALMLSPETSSPPLVAVDNSDEVIDIAKRFFMISDLKNLTLVHENAADYVQKDNIIYSHLLIDLYNAHHFPPECANEHFFKSCAKIITDDGFLALNLAKSKEQWPIFQIVKQQFKQTLVIPIKKSANMIIIASPHNDKELFIKKLEKTGELKRIIWVNSWGFVGDY